MAQVPAIGEQRVPLRADASGTLRIGGSRVTLDALVSAYRSGCTVDEICEQYPSLLAAEVYFVLGYYLQHRDELDVYLSARVREASQLRGEIEQHLGCSSLRQRLRERRRLVGDAGLEPATSSL